jgi:hypothetical protein
VSAADHSLRELVWMAEGRGLLTAWHLSGLVARLPLTGADLSPAAINPFRLSRAADRAIEEIRAWRARRAWRHTYRPRA